MSAGHVNRKLFSNTFKTTTLQRESVSMLFTAAHKWQKKKKKKGKIKQKIQLTAAFSSKREF